MCMTGIFTWIEAKPPMKGVGQKPFGGKTSPLLAPHYGRDQGLSVPLVGKFPVNMHDQVQMLSFRVFPPAAGLHDLNLIPFPLCPLGVISGLEGFRNESEGISLGFFTPTVLPFSDISQWSFSTRARMGSSHRSSL